MENIKIESTDQVLSILRSMIEDESIIAKIAMGIKETSKPVVATYQEEFVSPVTEEDSSTLQIKEVKRQSNRRKKLKVTKEPKIITLKDSSPKTPKKEKKSKTQLKEIHLF